MESNVVSTTERARLIASSVRTLGAWPSSAMLQEFSHWKGMLRILLQETLHTHQRFFKLIISRTISTPYISHTLRTKRTTWHYRYLLLKKQLLSKFLIGHACITDVRE